MEPADAATHTPAAVSAEIGWAAGTLEAALPGDPADRIVSATAQALDARLITADDKLRSASLIDTIW